MRIAIVIAALAIAAGPVSKFDGRPPEAVFTTSASPGDIERCLIDLDGWLAPNVYRQPDRPDQSQMLWATPDGVSVARVDLKTVGATTTVTVWRLAKPARNCAP
jgi:hypothetical protein